MRRRTSLIYFSIASTVFITLLFAFVLNTDLRIVGLRETYTIDEPVEVYVKGKFFGTLCNTLSAQIERYKQEWTSLDLEIATGAIKTHDPGPYKCNEQIPQLYSLDQAFNFMPQVPGKYQIISAFYDFKTGSYVTEVSEPFLVIDPLESEIVINGITYYSKPSEIEYQKLVSEGKYMQDQFREILFVFQPTAINTPTMSTISVEVFFKNGGKELLNVSVNPQHEQSVTLLTARKDSQAGIIFEVDKGITLLVRKTV